MASEPLTPEEQQRIDKILIESQGLSTEEPNLFEQEKYLKGFSLGALVYSTFYFIAMKDKTFVWLSIPCAILFPPLLLVFPFLARRRAYSNRKWLNFNEFERNQRLWDRAGWIGLIFMIIAGWLVLRYMFGLLHGFMDTNNLNQLNQQNLNDIQNNLQDIVGN